MIAHNSSRVCCQIIPGSWVAPPIAPDDIITQISNWPRLCSNGNTHRGPSHQDGSQRRRPSTIAEQPLKVMPEPADFQVNHWFCSNHHCHHHYDPHLDHHDVQSLRLRTSSESERARERAEREETRPVERLQHISHIKTNTSPHEHTTTNTFPI